MFVDHNFNMDLEPYHNVIFIYLQTDVIYHKNNMKTFTLASPQKFIYNCI